MHGETLTHRRLYTQGRLHNKNNYTQQLLLTDALHKDAFAHIKAHRRFYTQNLLHRDTFAQNNSFYTKKLLHKQILTHRNLYTQTWTAHFFYTETFTRRNFAQNSFCADFSVRKPLRTFFCTHNSFYIDVCNYTQMLLHVHTETCARSTLLHTTNFYIERLCVPFFDHLPFVFLSSIFENCSHESIAETF